MSDKKNAPPSQCGPSQHDIMKMAATDPRHVDGRMGMDSALPNTRGPSVGNGSPLPQKGSQGSRNGSGKK